MKENQSFIRQHEQKDCGVACLAMILKTYQTDVSFSELRELSGTNLEGTTALGLKKTLEAFNFKCDAFKADESVWQNNELKFPLIAHLVVDNQYTHYVVIYGIKKNKLIIGDPAQGKVEKTIEEFNQEWTGTLLFATPNEDYQPVQRKKISPIFIYAFSYAAKETTLFNRYPIYLYNDARNCFFLLLSKYY